MKDKEESLSFIFTEWGFSADEEGGELTDSMKQWKQRFGKDCWQALYDLVFQEKEEGSPSFVFLWCLASSFAHVLLTSPLFPFLKEKMEALLPEEERKSSCMRFPAGRARNGWMKTGLRTQKILLTKSKAGVMISTSF